ncbi:MAG: hypothetical protein ABJB40_02795 [Acidobacteriota bacterium]
MIELDHFYNSGFGWICRRCESEQGHAAEIRHSRIFREGEAESKNPELSNFALAKWVDITRRALTCPRCSITEPVEKS